MKMTAGEISSHAQSVWATENVQILERRQELLRATYPDLAKLHQHLVEFPALAQDTSRELYMSASTAGLYLAKTAYRDLHAAANEAETVSRADRLRRLTEIHNNFILPTARIERPELPIQARPSAQKLLPTCSSAEEYFIQASVQAETRDENEKQRVRVYHDSDGTPLALQKKWVEDSALLLQPANLEGAIVPAGTIVAVDESMKNLGSITGHSEFLSRSVITQAVDGPFAITPLRLSAWAYANPLDTALFAVSRKDGKVRVNMPRVEALLEHDLNTFRQVAKDAVVACTTHEGSMAS